MSWELSCAAPADPPRLEVLKVDPPAPGRGQVLVEQWASSINPIDVKRSSGYGQRLLALRGAGRFPLVLGNDIVGVVRAHGSGVSNLPIGTIVFGVMPTGRRGAHASHVVVDVQWLRPAPPGVDVQMLAALPYCFTTTWLALQGAGLTPETARGRSVLVGGASGALGQLAAHVLKGWGAQITAAPRDAVALRRLPSEFAAVLNFGVWENDAELSARLAPNAIGHATAVHPLLGNFDKYGWLRGALNTRVQLREARARVSARNANARYVWTVYRPSGEALDALVTALASGIALPVGWCGAAAQAHAGFDHVREGKPGRAVLTISRSSHQPSEN